MSCCGRLYYIRQFKELNSAVVPDVAEELVPDVEGELGLLVIFMLILDRLLPRIRCLAKDMACPDLASRFITWGCVL